MTARAWARGLPLALIAWALGAGLVLAHSAHVDPSNPLLLRASLQPLEPGIYTVVWRVLSVDGHVTEGRFTFRVE